MSNSRNPHLTRMVELPANSVRPPIMPEGLHADLRRLDVFLDRETHRFRTANPGPVDQFRGLYVGETQIESLLRGARRRTRDPSATAKEPHHSQDRFSPDSSPPKASPDSALSRLCCLFKLDDFERHVLLLALAPELHLRYEILYSYLNNDVTRKRPNCDLAFRLFCPDEETAWSYRKYFLPDAPLFRFGLLQWVTSSPEIPASSLARAFAVRPRIADFLLGVSSVESRIANFTKLLTPNTAWDRLPLPAEFIAMLRGTARLLDDSRLRALVLTGNEGAGKLKCAEAVCAERKRALLHVDVKALMAAPDDLLELVMLLAREQILANAGIYFSHTEAFFDANRQVLPAARPLARAISQCRAPVILGCDAVHDFADLLGEIRVRILNLPALPFSVRCSLWRSEIAENFGHVNGADVDSLANHFILNGGQIRAAVQAAGDGARARLPEDAFPSREELFAAARAQSQQRLRSLAQRIEPIYSWADLVLPPAVLKQLQEIENALKVRHVVMGDWGFEKRLSLGRGLKALFAGASGTGKTMTAEVLAHELGLDLYKIDLSSLVSKYIGETEKNLDVIFRAAQSSNAILFFDEADALFGKRSEVRDAHDRYANIEVAYLLQKTEEYEGFVILATNLAQNIDDAFQRRMNYTVEFPFPDETQRERLWRLMFPPQTPLGDGIDFTFLARQFPLAGGNIRSITLAAAFLAAADGSRVEMRHFIQSVAREMQKLGKLPSAAEFKQYFNELKSPPTQITR